MMLISRPFAWYTKAYYSHFQNKKRSYYEGFYAVVNVDQLLAAVLTVGFHAVRAGLVNPVRSLRSE